MLKSPDVDGFDRLMGIGDASLVAGDINDAERAFWQAHEIMHDVPWLHVRTHRRLLAIARLRRRWRSVGSHVVSIVVLSLMGLAHRRLRPDTSRDR